MPESSGRYEAVAHVLWELPFPLRLERGAFFVWEPEEGTAVFDPQPAVGDLVWARKSEILSLADVGYRSAGLDDPNLLPLHDYKVVCELADGRAVETARLLGGPAGGFRETRPYTIANLFLCLRKRHSYADASVLDRASAALNNLLDVYRFITMDPLARPISVGSDCYYTVTSVADVAPELGNLPANSLLRRIGELRFGHVVGENRAHTIGLNSFDDLFTGASLPESSRDLLFKLAVERHQLELSHMLLLSAIRRLKRSETALAVIDAQSAFESTVSTILVEQLKAQGITTTDTKLKWRLAVVSIFCRRDSWSSTA